MYPNEAEVCNTIETTGTSSAATSTAVTTVPNTMQACSTTPPRRSSPRETSLHSHQVLPSLLRKDLRVSDPKLSASAPQEGGMAFFLQQKRLGVKGRGSMDRVESLENSSGYLAEVTQSPKHAVISSARLTSSMVLPLSLSSSEHKSTLPLHQSFGSRQSILRNNASAPSLAKMRNRIVSSGNLSNASSKSSNSASSQALRGNAVMQVAQRSNGSAVKSVIVELQSICDEATRQKEQGEVTVEPPLPQLALLSQWAAVDSYYKVVIAKYKGIEGITNSMRVFSDDADVQVYGCTALGHLTLKDMIHQCRGIRCMVDAMKGHPNNIEVLSQAFLAVKKQGALLPREPQETHDELRQLVQTVQNMYLTRNGKEGVAFLTQFLQAYELRSPR